MFVRRKIDQGNSSPGIRVFSVQLLKNKARYNGKNITHEIYILLNNYIRTWLCGSIFSFLMIQYGRWDKTKGNNFLSTKHQNSVYKGLSVLPKLPSLHHLENHLTQPHVVRVLMVREWLPFWMLNTQVFTSDWTTNKYSVHGISQPYPKDILRTRLTPITSWLEHILAKSNILSSPSDILGHPLIGLVVSYILLQM